MVKLICKFIFAIAILTLVTADKKKKCPKTSPSLCLTKDCITSASRILNSMDESVDPCEDMYAFSCNGWIKDQHLEDGQGEITVFGQMTTKNTYVLKDLLSAPPSENDTSAVKKAKEMYTTCLNETQVFATTKPRVMNILQEYGKWPLITPNWTEAGFDEVKLEAYMQNNPATPSSMSGLIGLAVLPDFTKNTSQATIFLTATSFVLPRSYLLNQTKNSYQILQYRNFIANIATCLGNLSPAEIVLQVNALVTLETKLANISTDPEVLSEKNTFTSMTLAELTKRTNGSFPWVFWLQLVFNNITEITENERVIIYDEKYIYQIGNLIKETDKRTLANYMFWKFLIPLLIHLSAETKSVYYQINYRLYGYEQPPRWAVCVSDVDQGLGFALGRIYIDSEFPEESKVKSSKMFKNIQDMFVKLLNDEKWMDNKTREIAIDKVKNIQSRVGYPDFIRNDTELDKYYENVTISDTVYFYDLQSTAVAITKRVLKLIKTHLADTLRWLMNPQTVNAYYNRLDNKNNILAGILQSPFYYSNGLMAVNFGAIGAVAGHEFTHALDTNGKKFTKDGVMSDWWTENSTHYFGERAECFVDQYSKYCPEYFNNSLCVDGNQTLAENIADNGGLNTAFEAYKVWVDNHGKEKRLPGLQKYTPEQLFFISYAQLWCVKRTPQDMEQQIFGDSHSPGEYRVKGTIANSEDFHKVFKCNSTPDTEVCNLW